jgi:4'-phosphopantetheinyl transferase
LRIIRKDITLFWHFLCSREKKQTERFCNKGLSNKYIISHGVLRYILSYYIKQPPSDIQFSCNRYGKPFLKNYNIQFNLSHSHDIVAYVIASGFEVGIDVKWHNNKLDVLEFSNMVFTKYRV